MKIEHDEGKAVFEVPDKPTVRQQLAYFGATAGAPDGNYLIRFWMGARELITNWKSDIMPDIEASLDELTSPEATDIIIWAGIKVRTHMNSLEEIPKN